LALKDGDTVGSVRLSVMDIMYFTKGKKTWKSDGKHGVSPTRIICKLNADTTATNASSRFDRPCRNYANGLQPHAACNEIVGQHCFRGATDNMIFKYFRTPTYIISWPVIDISKSGIG
jgi:hypothetical protein